MQPPSPADLLRLRKMPAVGVQHQAPAAEPCLLPMSLSLRSRPRPHTRAPGSPSPESGSPMRGSSRLGPLSLLTSPGPDHPARGAVGLRSQSHPLGSALTLWFPSGKVPHGKQANAPVTQGRPRAVEITILWLTILWKHLRLSPGPGQLIRSLCASTMPHAPRCKAVYTACPLFYTSRLEQESPPEAPSSRLCSALVLRCPGSPSLALITLTLRPGASPGLSRPSLRGGVLEASQLGLGARPAWGDPPAGPHMHLLQTGALSLTSGPLGNDG